MTTSGAGIPETVISDCEQNEGKKVGAEGWEGRKTAMPPYAANWWRFLAG
jgi:hypothetical protein